MRFPADLKQAIAEESQRTDHSALTRASTLITERYKTGDYCSGTLDSPATRDAYLRIRMPATFAANARVFSEIAARAPGVEIHSMLDLGAGPGTSMWAAAETFPSIREFSLVERDPRLIEIGRNLAARSSQESIRSARWEHEDLSRHAEFQPHDLVVLSYVLGELNPAAAEQIIRAAWANSRKLLAVIEPGTPKNFARLLSFRSALIGFGAHPAAPCPHGAQCPLSDASDWCHFAERLERTPDHRRAKGATLGYEDEKFCYFVAAKLSIEPPAGRILRHPLKHKGHVQLTLCASQGIEKTTVARSQKGSYKNARKAEWGDVWPS